VLSRRRRLEVLQRRADLARRVGRHDLHLAALQEAEEALGVLLLLVRGLGEHRPDLLQAVLLRLAREVGVAIARLGFPANAANRFFSVFVPFTLFIRVSFRLR